MHSNHADTTFAHDLPVDVITYSPNGRWMVTSAQDMSVILWDPLNRPTTQRFVPYATASVVQAPQITISPESRYLAVCDGEAINIWDIDEGLRTVATIEGATRKELFRTCSWSPDGALIASSSRAGECASGTLAPSACVRL